MSLSYADGRHRQGDMISDGSHWWQDGSSSMPIVEVGMKSFLPFRWLWSTLRIFALVFGPYCLEIETVLILGWSEFGRWLKIMVVYTLGLPTSSIVNLLLSKHVLLQRFASTPWWNCRLVDFSGIRVLNDMWYEGLSTTYYLEGSSSYRWVSQPKKKFTSSRMISRKWAATP